MNVTKAIMCLQLLYDFDGWFFFVTAMSFLELFLLQVDGRRLIRQTGLMELLPFTGLQSNMIGAPIGVYFQATTVVYSWWTFRAASVEYHITSNMIRCLILSLSCHYLAIGTISFHPIMVYWWVWFMSIWEPVSCSVAMGTGTLTTGPLHSEVC